MSHRNFDEQTQCNLLTLIDISYMAEQPARVRNWCFTWNADEENMEDFKWSDVGAACPCAGWPDAEPKIAYLVCQVERAPETGHVHVQGYIQFKAPMRMAALKKLCDSAHWEPRFGTHDQAKAYCMKEDSRVNGPWELGQELGGQGKRNDLEAIVNLVKAKRTNLEIFDEVGSAAARWGKQICFARFTFSESDSDRQLQGVRVLVLYGATGAGKTYAAINLIAGGKDYYICEAPSHKDSKVWFDGYETQKTLILDDFEGSFCAYRYLLRLLDKYKLKIEVKGGHAWACWTTVVITSNIHPSGWYSGVDLAPLRRRLTEIRLCEQQGAYKKVDFDEHLLDQDFVNFVRGDEVPDSQTATPYVPHQNDLLGSQQLGVTMNDDE